MEDSQIVGHASVQIKIFRLSPLIFLVFRLKDKTSSFLTDVRTVSTTQDAYKFCFFFSTSAPL